jgi:hypothetical protein
MRESVNSRRLRRAETIRMDEEDGRTGPRSRQFGRLNAPTGVTVQSLPNISVPHPFAVATATEREEKMLSQKLTAAVRPPFTVHCPPFTKEQHHENVPGK